MDIIKISECIFRCSNWMLHSKNPLKGECPKEYTALQSEGTKRVQSRSVKDWENVISSDESMLKFVPITNSECLSFLKHKVLSTLH